MATTHARSELLTRLAGGNYTHIHTTIFHLPPQTQSQQIARAHNKLSTNCGPTTPEKTHLAAAAAAGRLIRSEGEPVVVRSDRKKPTRCGATASAMLVDWPYWPAIAHPHPNRVGTVNCIPLSGRGDWETMIPGMK